MRNLILLCRPHHRAVHRGFTITADGGELAFRRADGTILREPTLTGRAPP